MSKKVKLYSAIAALLYCGSFLGYYYTVKILFSGPSSNNLAKCGVFGDMFGGFNALFAGLGFVAVAITMYLQIEQYKDDKEKAHQNQVENTVFNMLATLREILSGFYMTDRDNSKEYKGIEYLKFALECLKSEYKHELLKKQKEISESDSNWKAKYKYIDKIPVEGETRKALVVKAYEEFYKKHEHNLGHYFRYLYNIFKYILHNFENKKPELARQYIGLIQAQMSNDELGLTFYNAISKHSRNLQQRDVFRNWLDTFDVFENIDPRCVFDDIFLQFYELTNFKYKIRDGGGKPQHVGEHINVNSNSNTDEGQNNVAITVAVASLILSIFAAYKSCSVNKTPTSTTPPATVSSNAPFSHLTTQQVTQKNGSGGSGTRH